jgi:hypothetical protein
VAIRENGKRITQGKNKKQKIKIAFYFNIF